MGFATFYCVCAIAYNIALFHQLAWGEHGA